jgi:hypothetical protein
MEDTEVAALPRDVATTTCHPFIRSWTFGAPFRRSPPASSSRMNRFCIVSRLNGHFAIGGLRKRVVVVGL